jgi:NitT/TauT family transport system ATP-binding protein
MQIKEGFALGTRVVVFDKLRHDPQDPGAYGATITYDLPLGAGKHALAVQEEKEAPTCSAK